MSQLNPHSVVPLYHQLKEILKENIESGTWTPGDRIPSEHQLRSTYGVSRNTVIKALDDLVREGLLYRQQGKGTFVAQPKIEQSLTGFYSFSRILKAKGLHPVDHVLDLSLTVVRHSMMKHLKMKTPGEAWVLKRLRCSGEEPIILETSYLPKKKIPRLDREKLKHQSLYDFLESEHGITVTRAKEIFEPVLIGEYESKLLQVSAGYPALLLDRIAYDSKGGPVEFCRSVVRGDRCRFFTELF
ncbi:GntR family transcriptional regulator [Melghirimyces profundicolus]|uniref:GntR family transcriptional regulator n=1 Tax=Melghirimyces profundicolus TaxID=1242148 RepID=A0A2T6C9C2_9BACL|nr:GntR family transcriptional regulator [Melghirimyces profundicolus]PTX64912.1 GntR family transcriptional regulator [Melghirimyces profundicolus]